MMVLRWRALVAMAAVAMLGTTDDDSRLLAQSRRSERGTAAKVRSVSELAGTGISQLVATGSDREATPTSSTDPLRKFSYSGASYSGASYSGASYSGASHLGGPASCSGCGLGVCGCDSRPPATLHRSGFFADALYLRPGNVDVTYTVEMTGCDPALSSPTGPTGRAGLENQLGVRAGFVHALSDCASLVASYTWYESGIDDAITAQPGTVLKMQVQHPSQASCGMNSLSAAANYDIDFQLVDLDYRKLMCGDCNWAVNWLGGVRYGALDQRFTAMQNTGAATGLSTVTTDVDFEGFGFRLGLDAERHSTDSGLLIYARGVANFLGGETKAQYRQVNQFGGAVPIGYDYEDYRIVSLLEAELGIGWQSCSGAWRVTTGYQTNAWFNSLTTSEYIRGVRAGNTDDIGDALTFDGFVSRVEWRY